jgi:hypothetical protein
VAHGWSRALWSGPGRRKTGSGVCESPTAATPFVRGAGDGNRTRTVSLGRVLILPCFRVLQRYWRPQLASGDPYRPGLVARAWPVLVLRVVRTSHWRKLPSRASPRRNRVSHYRGCQRPLSPFDACVPVNTAGIRGDVPSRFRRRRPALGTNRGGSRTGTARPMGRSFRPLICGGVLSRGQGEAAPGMASRTPLL